MAKSIFMIGGEESGDIHGAALIAELKRLMPGLRVEGMGGARMREAGLIGLDSKEVSVIGIVEVVEKLPKLWKAYAALKRRLAEGGFDAVVLIDFPDFNLHVGKTAKKLGIPVIYYISPQVWAWRSGRIKTIARLVRKMLVVFPFEKELYEKAGVDAEYVGHPLVDIASCELTKEEARAALNVETGHTVIALLPGSRTGELKRMLPEMLAAGAIIQRTRPDKPVFLLPVAASIEDKYLAQFLKDSPIEARVVRGAMHTVLRAADVAAVTSGTATLEAALIGTPMVIVYKIALLTSVVGRLMVRGSFVGLPNIVAGKGVVPELLQEDATAKNISRELNELLNNRQRREAMTKEFENIRAALGSGGAAARAAMAIKKTMTGKA